MGILCIRTSEIAFGEAQVIYRIQEVGLANTVWSADTDDPGMELKGPVNVVFKLDE
jgi:hypothetical protein